eukprot:Hpha_TRINITY_DN4456_c0_g1::TRINITY_DN4456_c0_g1_i1::g.50441::m.50441/K13348/MPV17; protein Mpv17
MMLIHPQGAWAQILVVQSAQAAGLMAFGDGVSQVVEHKMGVSKVPKEEPCTRSFNCTRWTRMICLNVVFQGATQYYFYVGLVALFPGTAWGAVVKRMLVDQLVYNPASNAAIMWSSVALDTGSASAACHKLRADFVTAMIPAWLIWIPGDLINFKYLPPGAQVAFYNAVNSVYLVYFSFVTNRHDIPELQDEEERAAAAKLEEEEEAAPVSESCCCVM